MHRTLADAPVLLPERSRGLRRAVLWAALLVGLAAGVAVRVPVAGAQTSATLPATPPAASTPAAPAAVEGSGASGKSTPGGGESDFAARIDIRKDASGNKVITIEKSGDAAAATQKGDSRTVTIDASGGVVEDTAGQTGAASGEGAGKRPGKRVRIVGGDQEFDSFEEFIHNEPALAGMVVGIVAVVFFAPVLAIGLILWYRFRKNRMLNETMLKLAEKGVVPPAQALGALAGGTDASAVIAGGTAAPIYEQAKQIRRRAAWSDLRKGVIIGSIGLGLAMSGSVRGLGLVLLFVGIGYIVLWWFEERQIGPRTAVPSGPAAPPPAPPAA